MSEEKKKRVTIQDIADRMNISKALVSFALSNKYGVSDTMRSKIVLMAMEMGYDFDNIKTAKTHRRTQKNNILLTINSSHLTEETYWQRIIVSIEQYLREQDMNFLITTWDYSEDEEALLYRMYQIECQGILLVGNIYEKVVEAVAKIHRPTVLIDCNYTGTQFCHVRNNNYGGARDAFEYLYAKGHRHMAYVGSLNHFSYSERWRGFSDAFNKRDDPQLRCEFLTDEADGSKIYNRPSLEKYLAAGNRPTAIFTHADQALPDIFETLRKFELRIPEDVSVMGFDGIRQVKLLKPRPTTIAVPMEKIGIMAARLLLDTIENGYELNAVLQMNPQIKENESVRSIEPC